MNIKELLQVKNFSKQEIEVLFRTSSSPDELFATNNHSVESICSKPERNYSYGALTQRRFVLQGWLSSGADSIPSFQQTLKSNDTIFTSRSEHQVIEALRSLGVDEVVARPATDLVIAGDHPRWLIPRPEFAPLHVYRVEKSAL